MSYDLLSDVDMVPIEWRSSAILCLSLKLLIDRGIFLIVISILIWLVCTEGKVRCESLGSVPDPLGLT